MSGNTPLVKAFMDTVKTHRRALELSVARTGVFKGQHFLLMRLAKCPNFSQTQLAKQLDVSTATLTSSLKSLEKQGYVQKAADEKDGRVNRLTLTEKGNRVVEQSREIFEMLDDTMFRGFDEGEKALFAAFLGRINDNLTEILQERT